MNANSRAAETRMLMHIALPLMAAYLAEFAMFQTTKMVVGKLGYAQLGAVGLAGDLSFEILIVMMGLLSIIGVLVAQAEGAGHKQEAGQCVRQGFLVATLLGLPATILIWNMDKLMALTGQDALIVELATPYVHALSGFALPVLWFSVMRSFVAALARTRVIMLISIAAVLFNYLLALGLVHGIAGLPKLGLAGAGWATTIVSWAMFLTLTLYVFHTKSLRGYGIFKGRFKIDNRLSTEIIWLGLPVAGIVLLEAGLFAAVAILSGVIGPTTLAAHGVIMAWIGIPFVCALGLAEATMVRVAHAIGSGKPASARMAGWLGMLIGIGLLLAMVIVPLGIPEAIVNVFVKPEDPGYAAVLELATRLLMMAAVFQVFDGLQAVASRALRGLKDNIVPMWIAAFGYWVLGIGGGSVLAFSMNMAGTGLWLGLAAGLIVTALLLTWRFDRLTKNFTIRHPVAAV